MVLFLFAPHFDQINIVVKQFYKMEKKLETASNRMNNISEVFYVDYGSNVQIQLKDLWFLDRQFFDFPAQAFQARLNGLSSSLPGRLWVQGTSKRFLQLVENRPLCARLMSLLESTYGLELVDTTHEERDVHINERLAIEQYAVFPEIPHWVHPRTVGTK